MALVRVYCGLASADTGVVGDEGWLTTAVVDDAGRLLDVCEIGDDANGYATLSALLAERSSAPSAVAVAADSDDHLVTMLLTTAGRPLSVVDDDAADDYAERFADDESPDEIESAPAERRAVGLARALQAGALSAHAGPAPRDLAGLKPVLSAHCALTHGRHGAAGALREVLRELYPAALRAYPDPAEHVALAILDALPEPGLLAAPATGRNRDTALAVDSVAAQIAASGVTDHAGAVEAVTALRVAIAETPRRGGVTKHLTTAIAETVRQAVAAVRACDAACAALIATVAERVATPAPATKPLRRVAKTQAVAAPATPALRPVREPAETSTRPMTAPRRSRPPLAPVSAALAGLTPTSGAPLPPGFEPTPIAGVPILTSPVAPHPVAPQRQPVSPAPAPVPVAQAPAQPQRIAQPKQQPQPVAPLVVPQPLTQPMPSAQPVSGNPLAVPAQRVPPDAPGRPAPADVGAPFVPTLTQAAINNARAERLSAPADPLSGPLDEQGMGVGAAEVVLPLSRSVTAVGGGGIPEMPGSRSSWPLLGDRDDRPDADDANGYDTGSYDVSSYDVSSYDTGSYDKVTPPWLADDLVLPEPPALRLVDAGALEEPLRQRPRAVGGAPVADDADDDLLIFSTIRSAWFTGHADPVAEEEPTWNSEMDLGWRAAEHAATPSFGEETRAGLPKRVPQANLVPGSPIAAPERPLRIVRDPQRLAQHTSGYFRGWRRGQEVNGYAVGGRPGRESAGGWDFSRDQDDRDDYGYRSAGYGQ